MKGHTFDVMCNGRKSCNFFRMAFDDIGKGDFLIVQNQEQPMKPQNTISTKGKMEGKMKKHRILTVISGLAILVSGTLAVKAIAFGPHHSKGGCLGLRALMDLDLSGSQKAEVRGIIGKYREKGKQIRDQLLEAKEKSMDVIEAEPFDEEKIRQAFQQISPLLEEGMVLKAKLMAELRPVLSPDQLELLKQKKAEHSGRMKKDMHFRESMMDTWLQMGTE